MKTVFFMRGLPGSGKTTWATRKLKTLNRGGKIRGVRTNKDEIREELRRTGSSGEGEVIRREFEQVTEAMVSGLHVIIDNTHFKPEHEWRYRELAEKYGYKFEVVSLEHVTLEECIRRDELRSKSIGVSAILRVEEYRKSQAIFPPGAPQRRGVTLKPSSTDLKCSTKRLEGIHERARKKSRSFLASL